MGSLQFVFDGCFFFKCGTQSALDMGNIPKQVQTDVRNLTEHLACGDD